MAVSGINYVLSMAEGVIEGLVWGVNKKLIDPDSFIVSPIKALPPLNITASQAPDMDSTSDLINIWLDGRFINPETSQSSEPINDVAPVRIEDKKQME